MKSLPITPIREIANSLILQIKKSVTHGQLSILRGMADNIILQRYAGDPQQAKEYVRVDLELRSRETELAPNEIEAGCLCNN